MNFYKTTSKWFALEWGYSQCRKPLPLLPSQEIRGEVFWKLIKSAALYYLWLSYNMDQG